MISHWAGSPSDDKATIGRALGSNSSTVKGLAEMHPSAAILFGPFEEEEKSSIRGPKRLLIGKGVGADKHLIT